MIEMRRAASMGLKHVDAAPDFDALRTRIDAIENRLERSVRTLLTSQGVQMLAGTGRVVGPHEVEVTGGRRHHPAGPRRHHRAVHRQPAAHPRLGADRRPPGAHHPRRLPAAGAARAPDRGRAPASPAWSSCTCSRRSARHVTLIVSRQQVLPQKDPEVAAVLEDDFLGRGVRLFKGARAEGIDLTDDGVSVRCDDGRVARGLPRAAVHRLDPQLRGPRPRGGGRRARRRLRGRRPQLQVIGPQHLRRRRPVREAAALVGGLHAGPQDRRARPRAARRAAPPHRLREGGLGHLHRPRDRRRRPGRGRRLRRGPQGAGHQGARSRRRPRR